MDDFEGLPASTSRPKRPYSVSPGSVDGVNASSVRDRHAQVASAGHAATAIPAPVEPPKLPHLPKLLSPYAARKRLGALFRGFAGHVVRFIDGQVAIPRIDVARATVGLGKTRNLSTTLPRILAKLPSGKAIAIAEPTLRKCDEVREQLIKAGVARASEIVVLRGREAENPSGDYNPDTGRLAPMCARTGAVRAIAGFVDDVSRRMCRQKWTDQDGEEHVSECPFYAQCAYIKQQQNSSAAKIIIVPHAALQTGQSELSEEKGRLVAIVIDEDATRALISHADIPVANVWAVPADPAKDWPCREPNMDTKLPGGAELPADPTEAAHILKARYLRNLTAIKAVVEATRADTRRAELRPSQIAAALGDAHQWGVGEKQTLAELARQELSFMAVFERRKDDLKTISPDTPDETVIETVALHRIHDRFRLATFWTRLRDQVDAWAASEDERRDYCRSVLVDWLATTKTEAGDPVSVPALKLHYSKELRGGAGRVPTLILDADADEILLSRWLKIDRFERIDAAFSKVIIRQAVDRSGSMASMKKEATRGQMIATANYLAAKQRGHIKAGVRTVTDFHSGIERSENPRAVALFSIKAAIAGIREAHMVEDARQAQTAAIDANVDPDFVSLGHYGELRGLNSWESCAGAVLAGRIELSADALEDHARAIWCNSTDLLDYIETPPEGSRRLDEVPDFYRTKKGAVPTVRTGHRDPRIDAVLRSIREAELRQALGRVRPVQRPDQTLPVCEVVVLTSVPLGLDVEIDSIHDWNELAADQIDRVWTAGIIPDHSGDLAALADMSEGALRTAMHRRRAKRDIQAPAPGRRFAADRARSAYADALGKPGDLDIGDRRMCRFSYTVEDRTGELVTRRATVLIGRGETRRAAFERACEVLYSIGAIVAIEGAAEDEPGFAAEIEADAGAWWLALPAFPPTPGSWGRAAPPPRPN